MGEEGLNKDHYIIRGGVEGRERLRVVARVMAPTTLDLFEQLGVRPGMVCLDVGCGGGDLTLDLARLVGPEGHVVGADIDGVKLDLAREQAEAAGCSNVTFRELDIRNAAGAANYDLVYARFVLTHLPDPRSASVNMRRQLRPGGLLITEDVDFRGYFCEPDASAFRTYVDLYTRTVLRRGGDPNIGPRLPGLLREAGLDRVGAQVIQPAALSGETKAINALTLENVADAVVAEGLATGAEIEEMVCDLYELANDETTFMSIPRIVQAWGYWAAA